MKLFTTIALIASSVLSFNAAAYDAEAANKAMFENMPRFEVKTGRIKPAQVQAANEIMVLCKEIACDKSSNEYKTAYHYLSFAKSTYLYNMGGGYRGERRASRIRQFAIEGRTYEIELEYQGFWKEFDAASILWEDLDYMLSEGYSKSEIFVSDVPNPFNKLIDPAMIDKPGHFRDMIIGVIMERQDKELRDLAREAHDIWKGRGYSKGDIAFNFATGDMERLYTKTYGHMGPHNPNPQIKNGEIYKFISTVERDFPYDYEQYVRPWLLMVIKQYHEEAQAKHDEFYAIRKAEQANK